MGNKQRVGRNRRSGPDPLARLAPPAAPPVESPWGVTGMPNWLDTPPGRQAWAEHEQFECLDDAEQSGTEDSQGDGWHDGGDDWPGSDDHLEASGVAHHRRAGLESLGDGDDEDDWEEEWTPPKNRLTMLPPAAIGLIIVGLIACGIAGFSLLKGNEPVAPLVAFESSAGPREPSNPPKSVPAASTAPDGQMVVSVVGMVKHPGLVRLPPSARVADAIDRAGGARPGADLLSLNMAQMLRDGEQILVGKAGDGLVKSAVVGTSGAPTDPGQTPAGGSVPAQGTDLVDLNSATAEQLDALPGVGPVTAAAILAWRDTNGRFSSVEQLAEIEGIGPARLAKLTPLVTVG
ncbi:helix-hairpin-helix domain-containing protein [Gordonia sp. (in: high G+C Gram-positive bacteria)]|uniref:helix-hairpin-helix domain-containing protein n=1 Tax=Gordonia sp. (in: high G+C Gram-positive bacteria) TaxID=84139 RepID=UPI003C737CE3